MISPLRTVLVFLFCILLAILCLSNLKSGSSGAIVRPSGIAITFVYRGAAPAQVESKYTSLLENALSQIGGLKNIYSRSNQGNGYLILQFEPGTDVDFRIVEIRGLIRQLKNKLPAATGFPLVTKTGRKNGDARLPVYSFSISGREKSYESLSLLEGTLIKKALSTLDGIRDIKVTGKTGMNVSVQVDPFLASRFNIGLDEVEEKLKAGLSSVSLGNQKDFDGKPRFVATAANVTDIESLSNVTVGKTGAIRLKDIADIDLTETENTAIHRINGQNAITVDIYPNEREDRICLSDSIISKLSKVKKQLPLAYTIGSETDYTSALRTEIKINYLRTVISLIVLVILIFFSYRDPRHIINLIATLVVNLSLTFILLAMLKINLTVWVIAGLAFAFSIMVDHAIIALDYYREFRDRSVAGALIACTMATICGLSVVYWSLSGDADNFTEFITVICISLAASLLTNIFFTPACYSILETWNISYWKRSNAKKNDRKRLSSILVYSRLISSLSKRKFFILMLATLLFGWPFFMIPEKFESSHFLQKTLGSELYQYTLRPVLDKWTGGVFRLFYNNIYSNYAGEKTGNSKLIVTAELPVGHTQEKMDYIIRTFEQQLYAYPQISEFVSYVTSGQNATIEISFDPNAEKTGFPFRLRDELTTKSLLWNGVGWKISGVGRGFSNAAQADPPSYRYKLSGYNYQELERLGQGLAGILKSNNRMRDIRVTSTGQLEDPDQQFVLSVNNRAMGLNRATLENVYKGVSERSDIELETGKISYGEGYIPVIIKNKFSDSYDKWEMMNTGIPINSGRHIKLDNLGTISLEKQPESISRENRQYILYFSYTYFGTKEIGDALSLERFTAFQKSLKMGYTIVNENFSPNNDMGAGQFWIMLIILASNFVIASMLFEEFRNALVITLAVPLSFTGAFLAFYLMDTPFDQGGYGALILLDGMILNSGIFLIHDLKRALPNAKESYNNLLAKIILNRSRTILLTTIASVLGMVAFLTEGKEAAIWYPLAIGLIGGLIFSLVVVFILIPAFLAKNNDPMGNSDQTLP
jgi:multidrug efflux pump subunit AcrB